MSESNEGRVCAVCGAEIPAGSPVWRWAKLFGGVPYEKGPACCSDRCARAALARHETERQLGMRMDIPGDKEEQP